MMQTRTSQIRPVMLYGAKGSGSATIEMALSRTQAHFEWVDAAPWTGGPGFEVLKQINPLGQIPTLVLADGTVLTESAAILLYLADTFPHAHLLPAEPSARALATRGLVYIAANCYSAVTVVDYPERFTLTKSSAAHDRIRAAAKAQLHARWDQFADIFHALPELNGGAPGALAFFTVVVSRWCGTRSHWQTSRPDFHKRIVALERHPDIAPTLQRHWGK